MHHWAETGRLLGSESHVATLSKKLEATGITRLWKPGGQHEVSFALHLTTLELRLYDRLEEELNRDDWKAGFSGEWLTGTIDWMARGTDDDYPHVSDLKTGRWPVDPTKSRQLRSYLLVLWVMDGMPMEWLGVVSIVQWPRYPLTGMPATSYHSLVGFDMLEHLEELRWSVQHPEEVRPGDNCFFCQNREPHFATPWMKSWKHSKMSTCWPGAITMLREGRLEQA